MPRGKVVSAFTELTEDDKEEVQNEEDFASLQSVGYVQIYDPEDSGLGQCQEVKGYAHSQPIVGSRWLCIKASTYYVILTDTDNGREISCP